jgi:hypothetical protein
MANSNGVPLTHLCSQGGCKNLVRRSLRGKPNNVRKCSLHRLKSRQSVSRKTQKRRARQQAERRGYAYGGW